MFAPLLPKSSCPRCLGSLCHADGVLQSPSPCITGKLTLMASALVLWGRGGPGAAQGWVLSALTPMEAALVLDLSCA